MIKAPKQANAETQKDLTDVTADKSNVIVLSSGRKIRIGWMRPDTQDKIDELTVEYERMKKHIDKNDEKQVLIGNSETRKYYAKTAAAILINNYFGLKLRWWIKWRIIHHFWHMNGEDYLLIVSEAKKKATEQEYYLAMALLMNMPQIWTAMTEKEAEVYRQELELARKQAL